MFDWEKRLQESQRRLVEEQRLLNEREDSANEADHILKKKETELEETREAIEASKRSLKLEEDDITIRLSSLASKEKVQASLTWYLVQFLPSVTYCHHCLIFYFIKLLILGSRNQDGESREEGEGVICKRRKT